MKSIVFFFLCLSLMQSSLCQIGFNHNYRFEETGTSFINVVSSDDTLFIYGTFFNPEVPNQVGLFLAQLDTLGNLINYTAHYDSTGIHYAPRSNATLLELANGDFAVVGNLISGPKNYLAIFSRSIELKDFITFDDPEVLQSWFEYLIEIDSGYLIAGFKQNQNGYLDIFVMKIDNQGNELWEESYGGYDEDNICLSFIKIDDDTFVIGGGRAGDNSVPIEQRWANSTIFAIDSTGTVLWEWESNEGANNEISLNSLHHTQDGGWLYNSNDRIIHPVHNVFVFYPKIVKRDSDMNLLWEIPAETIDSDKNIFRDIHPTPEGNWVATGQLWQAAENEEDQWQGGCLYKFTDDGNLLWSRCDTVQWGIPDTKTKYYLGGVTTLSSGSIVTAARVDRTQPAPASSYGWLLKTDINGCVDTLCDLTSLEEIILSKGNPIELKLYPNPTSDFLNIFLRSDNNNFQTYEFRIRDVSGHLVQRLESHFPEETMMVSVTDLETGVYFLEAWQAGKLLQTTKFIVQR